MPTVTKRDLVKRINEKIGLSQREVLDTIEQLMAEITQSLAIGDEVVLRNFGTFQIAINKPKKGRNPKRPEVEIIIPERRVVKFKSGKLLKEQVMDKS